MSGAFQYRPKFVDIRVRPPVEGEAERETDVHALKPDEVQCDHPGCRRAEANEEAGRHLGKLERNALADLDLQNDAQPTVIRARYTELVKRCHPDANGGDRSAEHKLQRVIKAYKTLQKAGMV